MESEITLQILLIKPTPGVMFGLQKGSGSRYETVQKQISTSSDLTFECAIKVKGSHFIELCQEFQFTNFDTWTNSISTSLKNQLSKI